VREINFCHRKEQKQQAIVKAKKLDINFDDLGNLDLGEETKQPKEEKLANEAKTIAPVIPEKKVKIEHKDVSAADTGKFKKMKAISSTDYMYFIAYFLLTGLMEH